MPQHGIGFLASSVKYPERVPTFHDWGQERKEHEGEAFAIRKQQRRTPTFGAPANRSNPPPSCSHKDLLLDHFVEE